MSSKRFKECPTHGWLPKSGFYTLKHKARKKPYYQCKLCTKDYCNSKAGKENRNRLRREWRQKHPEQDLAMDRAKVQKKPEKYKAINKRERDKLRLEVLRHYSGSDIPFCDCCGDSHLEFMALDHKNGGGNKHRRRILKSMGHVGKKVDWLNMYRWARQNNYPDIFRVLCHSCNFSYGAYGYCPHQKERKTNVGHGKGRR